MGNEAIKGQDEKVSGLNGWKIFSNCSLAAVVSDSMSKSTGSQPLSASVHGLLHFSDRQQQPSYPGILAVTAQM